MSITIGGCGYSTLAPGDIYAIAGRGEWRVLWVVHGDSAFSPWTFGWCATLKAMPSPGRLTRVRRWLQRMWARVRT